MPRSVRRNVPRANETWAWASPGHAPPPRGVASALQAPRQAPPQRGMSPPKPTACAGCEHGGDPAPRRRVTAMCGRRALGTVRHSSILSARRFALTGTGRTPRAGFPLPQGPTQRAAWPPTPGGAAAKFWGEGTRQGRASLASPSWPPPHPPRPSPPTHRPSAPAPHVPCHSALPLLPWPREQVQTPSLTLLEAGTGDGGPPPSWPHAPAGTLASLGPGFLTC